MACYPWSWMNLLQQPTLEAFQFMYDAKISVEVRDQLLNWIKSQVINTPTYFNDENKSEICEQNAATFLNRLVKKLQQTGAKHSNDIRNELKKSAGILLQRFSDNPLQLYQQLKKGLQWQYITYPYKCADLADMEVAEVFDQLRQLQLMVHKNEVDNCFMKKEHDYIVLERNEMQKDQKNLDMILNDEIQTQRTYQLVVRKEKWNDRLHMFSSKRTAMINEFRHTILKTGQLQDKILNKYLSQWKINQRFVGIGATAKVECNLDTIQMWCEILVAIIWNMKVLLAQVINTQLDECINLMEAPDLMTAMKDVTGLYEMLICSSVIVEKQPPQIMKTNSRFGVTMRLLLGKTFHMSTIHTQVTVSIISEVQAQEIHQTNTATNCSAGEVTNNVSCLEYDAATTRLSAVFNNMRLQNIKRTNKQLNKCVLDEKFALLFQLQLTEENCGIAISVWAISCPVVVIVHVNQMQQSLANIIWDNAFGKIDRIPFNVPDKVCWNWLANALSMKFNGTSGHSLTADQMHFLCEKALGDNQPFPVPDDLMIMWSQFCKENLRDCGYTFWEWFYLVMKLTHEHLHKLWFDGRIIGFIQRKQAEKYLAQCQPGTFLLRFSDTVIGGITIAFVHERNDGQHEILHIQPFTAKELYTHSLADRILDFDELTYLYPDIPKHVAFQRHEKKGKPPQDSTYVAWKLQAALMLPSDHTTTNQMPASSQQTFDIDQLFCVNLDDIDFFWQDM